MKGLLREGDGDFYIYLVQVKMKRYNLGFCECQYVEASLAKQVSVVDLIHMSYHLL